MLNEYNTIYSGSSGTYWQTSLGSPDDPSSLKKIELLTDVALLPPPMFCGNHLRVDSQVIRF